MCRILTVIIVHRKSSVYLRSTMSSSESVKPSRGRKKTLASTNTKEITNFFRVTEKSTTETSEQVVNSILSDVIASCVTSPQGQEIVAVSDILDDLVSHAVSSSCTRAVR